MATEWFEAPRMVVEMAQHIIEQHHEDLLDARVAFIMRDVAPVVNGRATLGKARKVSAEQQVHMPYDFVIWLAQDMWYTLTPMQKEALIDHELSHCEWLDDKASIRGHDIEEFNHIIERYGFWWPHNGRFDEVVQKALLIPQERRGKVEAMAPSEWVVGGE